MRPFLSSPYKKASVLSLSFALLRFYPQAFGTFLVLLVLVQCSPPQENIPLGAVLATTGPASWLGEPEKRTLEMLSEKINGQGGIDGLPVKIYIEDSQGSPERAVTAAKRLISSKKVWALIGPTRSGSALAVANVARRYNVPMIALAASDKILKTAEGETKPWVFTTAQKSSDAAARIMDILKIKNPSKIGLLSGNTGFGLDGRQRIKENLARAGFELVADEVYQPGDTDMTSQLSKLKRLGAEAIINWSIVPAQSIVARNMVQMGYKVPLIQSHGFGNQKYVQATGRAGEGILFPGGRLLIVDELQKDHPQYKVLSTYKTAYEKLYNEEASTFGGHAWDAFYILMAALRKGARDQKSIRDHIENTHDFIGIGGVFNMSPEDHNGLDAQAFSIIEVKNGRFSLYSE